MSKKTAPVAREVAAIMASTVSMAPGPTSVVAIEAALTARIAALAS
jgi:hypothetical protein